MADSQPTEPDADAPVTFKVKTGTDTTRTITMPQSTTIAELKTHLAELEGVDVERQRLIYSGRVLKNDDTLASYKIKPNNTVHMVKNAASNMQNRAQSGAGAGAAAGGVGGGVGGRAAAAAAQGVPTSMASGTAPNDMLAALTGARFAGMANLPGREMFGPDGGLTMPDEEEMARMLRSPEYRAAMDQVLDNPQLLDQMIQMNPTMRNMPNAREVLRSPFMRALLTNPELMVSMGSMRRAAATQNQEAFPAPGVTDTTPEPAVSGGADAGTGAGAGPGAPPLDFFNLLNNPAAGSPAAAGGVPTLGDLFRAMGGGGGGGAAATGATGSNPAGTAGAADGGPAENPFGALFGMQPPGTGAGAPAFDPARLLSLLGAGANATPPEPQDTRPPEERYETQLRQLNDMGFYDFDLNVTALRRSGGSVQGAVEYLLSNS